MKKTDTEQTKRSVLEENKNPGRRPPGELDRELQEIDEESRREEMYYEERRRERHERILKRQIRNRNLALIITALVVICGAGYFFGDQIGLKDGVDTLMGQVKSLLPEKRTAESKDTQVADNTSGQNGDGLAGEDTAGGENTADDASGSEDGQNADNASGAENGQSTDGASESEGEQSPDSVSGSDEQGADGTNEPQDAAQSTEASVTPISAEELGSIMPQASAAGVGIIRRQIRHERKVLTTAKEKATQYDYDGAISLLQKDNAYVRNVHFQNAAEKFQQKKDKCVAWTPDKVTHIFYHSLIVDTSKAFDGDYKQDGYNQVMTTMEEFNKITQIMYDEGYVMVNLYDLAGLDDDGNMHAKTIYLPKGKKPFVLSQDDVCYYHSQDGDGIATKLVIDEEGKVRNEYVQDDGSTVIGDYDVVPLIDRFVEEHPDFAYHGHKGIVALTGYNGILGYRTDISYQTRPDDLNDDKKAWLDAHPDFDLETERAGAKKVADAMKAEGWTFASHTWGHKNMSTVSMERLETDTQNFKENVDPLIGGTDIIIFAFGADINTGGEYTGNEKFQYLKSQGYDYYCNVDSNQYFVQMTDEYFRMGRRNVDGYRMYYNPDLLADLFDASEVFDPSRPTPVPPMNGG